MDRRILYSKKRCKYATAVIIGLFIVGIKTYANQDASQLSAGVKFQKMLQAGRGGMSKGSSIMADVNKHMMIFENEMRNAVHDYSNAKTPAERRAIKGKIEKIKDDLYHYNSRVQQKLIAIQKKLAEKLRNPSPDKKPYSNPYNPYDSGSGLINPYRQ